ncbi:MAG: hypothetical protein A2007_03565 [Verrucomicrobia bacterium GWC2_42_7]|nr:MAG: hypothetical protein A2007_03565 [Verrucomicrobia bacterium GWC2_42_7]
MGKPILVPQNGFPRTPSEKELFRQSKIYRFYSGERDFLFFILLIKAEIRDIQLTDFNRQISTTPLTPKKLKKCISRK